MMAVDYRQRTCVHGCRTITMPANGMGGDGWLMDVVLDCPKCPKATRIGLSYKPGTPPPQSGDRQRRIAAVAADVARREASESAVRPLPETCLECGGVFSKDSLTVSVSGGGRRHATGSLACRRTSSHTAAHMALEEEIEPEERLVSPPNHPETQEEPEPPNCPTCGRPVVEGVPYDLPAIRKALQNGIDAVDALIAGEKREQAMVEQLEELGDRA